MNSKSYILLVLTFFVSCQSKDFDKKSFKNKIKVTRTISISLDSFTTNQLSNPQVIKDKYLAFINKKINSLDLYDIQQKRLSQRIKFANEGDNAIGNIHQFLYHNDDTIFVVNSYQYKVFLINQEGNVKEKYSLIKQKKHSSATALPNIFPFNCPPVFLDKKLHIASYPDDNPYKDSYYNRKALSIILDLNTKNFKYAMSFPKLYKEKKFALGHSFYSRIFLEDKKKFIYGFFANQSIQITDENYHIVEEKKLNSPNFVEIPSINKRVENPQENTEIFNSNPSYFNIYYNPYKKEFYRAIDIPLPNKSKKDKYSKGFLGIFDENFANIGEVLLFETHKVNYSMTNIFFTPEGMWIQRFTDNEDELVYDLVEFVAE